MDWISALPCLQPEWARYMVESIPEKPYRGDISAVLSVESNMKERFVNVHSIAEGSIFS
jgi:hypothetical protein